MSNRKNFLYSYPILALQMATQTITSQITEISFLDNIGIQVDTTGNLTGTLSVQVSADHEQDSQGNVSNAGNWITLTTQTITTGTPTFSYFDLNQLSAPYIRLVWTYTSGTGFMEAFICGKVL